MNCSRFSNFISNIAVFILTFSIPYAIKGQTKSYDWKIEQYSPNIVKLTYLPNSYEKNENVSDAVILQPFSDNKIPITLSDKGATILVGDTVHISYIEDTTGYKGFSLKLKTNEKIYGGGERAIPINRRGFAFDLHNNPWYGYEYGADNLNYSVPFFTSSRNFGIFFDNPSSGKVDIGKSDPDHMKVTFFSSELNVFIIFGDTSQDVLSQYHTLTGTQPLPPRWVLGNFMSRFGYKSEKQLVEIANVMDKNQIPYDGIIIDLFWFGDQIKGTLGNLSWVNKKYWPNPKKMIQELSAKRKKTILVTEPFVLKSSLNYNKSKKLHAVNDRKKPYVLTDFYFGPGGLIDIFRKDARNWFWKQYDKQNKIGIQGWWGDLGEPEKHPSDLFHNLSDFGHNRLFSAQEVHNIYGHYWTKMLYEKFEKHYPNTRLFSLNRSGFAGTQRYGIFPWSGDVSRSWGGLKAQLPLMLGMAMSGIPYIHSDAGGFAGGEGDYELYIRWLQFSAFTPILRPHGTALFDIEPQAFSFPSEPGLMPEPYLTYARNIIQTRYKLLPYNYTLAYLQTTQGKPLVSPMYHAFPFDQAVNDIEDQYMWGDDIMVVPILQKGQTQKKVIFPKGKWYRFSNDHNQEDTIYENIAEFDCPLNSTLLFSKSGAIIPMSNSNGTSSEDFHTKALQIHYYVDTDQSSHYIMYDDDGVSKNALIDGHYELLDIKVTPERNGFGIVMAQNHHLLSASQRRMISFIIHGLNTSHDYVYKIEGEQKYQPLHRNSIPIAITDKSIKIHVERIK
ncbi:MAG: glycoside hydrolase family 31 protein [Saprospiraceae bacterium]